MAAGVGIIMTGGDMAMLYRIERGGHFLHRDMTEMTPG